jgi:hypothetical protein
MELSNIVSFIKKALPFFHRSDLASDLELSITYIQDNVIESYKNLDTVLKVSEIQSAKGKALVKGFYKELDVKDSKVRITASKNLGQDMVTLFTNVKANAEMLLKELEDNFSNTVVTSALTAKKAFVLRSVGHFSFLSKYATSALNYIYVFEALELNSELDDSYKLVKSQIADIEKNLWVFSRLLSVYATTTETFRENFNHLKEITINAETESAVSLYEANEIDFIDNISSGFVGSPIYSVKLVFAQWEASRYKELKDSSKLLQLRYLHYKLLKESGNTDLNVERELENLAKRVSDYDYEIAKMQEGLE